MTRNIKVMVVGVIIALAGLFFAVPALYATGGSCTDQTSVVKCGVNGKAEILAAYDKNERSTQTIYNYMGITRAGIVNASFVSGNVFRNGDVFVNGQKVATGARTAGHSWGSGYSQVKIPNTTDAYSYTTGALVSDNRPLLVSMVNGEFKFAIMTDCGNPIKANPVPKPPQPVYKCDNLVAAKITRNEYSFTTNAVAANGASIRDYSYNFGDGTTAAAGATTKHTYAKPGTYTVRVNVRVTVNGQTVNAPGDCVVTVPVAPEPCPIPGKESLPKDSPLCVEDKPSVSIDKTVNGAEHASVKVGEHFTYRLIVKNTGNVMLDDTKVTDEAPAGISFVSSATGEIVNNAWSTVIDDLDVGESKTFDITAKLTKYVAGTIKNTACVDTPTVPGKPDDCDDATVDTPKLLEVCRLEDKAIVTINDDQFDATKYSEDKTKCAEAPNPKADTPVVTELPKTGIVDSLGGGVGLGAIAASLYYYRASRRLL